MKKKLVMAVLVGTLTSMSLSVGVGATTATTTTSTTTLITPKAGEEDAEATETPAPLKTIGTEETDAYEIKVKNNTGANITKVEVKASDAAEYGENLLTEGDVYTADEKRNLYYLDPAKAETAAADATADTTTDAAAEKVYTNYDIRLTFEDGTTAELHAVPMENMNKAVINKKETITYLTYKTVDKDEKVDTYEAEKAIADAAAQAAAEAQAAADAQAAAEAQAAADAAAQDYSYDSSYDDSSYDYSYDDSYDDYSGDDGSGDDGSGGGDGCLDDGLLN